MRNLSMLVASLSCAAHGQEHQAFFRFSQGFSLEGAQTPPEWLSIVSRLHAPAEKMRRPNLKGALHPLHVLARMLITSQLAAAFNSLVVGTFIAFRTAQVRHHMHRRLQKDRMWSLNGLNHGCSAMLMDCMPRISTRIVCISSDEHLFQMRRAQNPDLVGPPLGPELEKDGVFLRYMYDGGKLAQGHLCHLTPASPAAVTGREVLATLQDDGVDLSRFLARIYVASLGGWLPIDGDDLRLPLGSADMLQPRRIDVKLCVRDAACKDALQAEAAAVPSGTIPDSGFCGIGVVYPRTQENVGSLWRSAYQLGAAFIFTIGIARDKHKGQKTDTVKASRRLPYFEHSSWSEFVTSAPQNAQWVAVEMGGTPLDEFEHPRNAIYLLGAENTGMPKCVLNACDAVISLRSERYASFNVAVAGSLVLYDRLEKEQQKTQSTANVTKPDMGESS